MNVISFNPDEWRGDLMGCAGDPLIKTPNVDRLAAEGVNFTDCHVQHTVCSPSRCSFLTGWYPHVRGHRSLWHLLTPEEPDLFRHLKQAGHEIAWWGKNDVYAPDRYAGVIDFLNTDLPTGRGHRHGANAFAFGKEGYFSFLSKPMVDEPGETDLTDASIRFLKNRRPGDPPFTIFHAWGLPHCPYSVPEPWYSMYDPDDLPPLRPADLEGKPQFMRLMREYRGLTGMDASHPLMRKIRAVYLGMISYVDHQLGRILDALDETGLAQDTVVVVFSDHGDWAGDYGMVEKWPSGVDSCLTRSPLVVRAPGCAAGHVVDTPVELMDIMPTTLELCGVEATHPHFATSLVPQLKGAAGDPHRIVHTEGGYDQVDALCYEGSTRDILMETPDHIYHPKGKLQQEVPSSVCRCVSARNATHQVVRRTDGQHELYDLVADPQELTNRYGDPALAGAQAALEAHLLDWYVATSDVTLLAHPREHPSPVVLPSAIP